MTTLPPPARFCPRCGSTLAPDDAGRPTCTCGYTSYDDPKVAVGVLVERDGHLLLVRRNHQPAIGQWAFPSGFVDAGEVLEEAAAREVREETGLDVRIDRLLGAWSSPGRPVVFLAYAGVAAVGEAVAGDEADEVAWFHPDALPQLAFDHDDEIVQVWRSGAGVPVIHRPARTHGGSS